MLVTLDINVIRDALDDKRRGHAVAIVVFDFIRRGTFLAQVTNRLDRDVPNGPLRETIEALTELGRHRPGAPGRVGVSKAGSLDYVVSESESEEFDAVMHLVFPGALRTSKRHKNRIADIDHMFSHRTSGANFFVTCEKSMLERADTLQRVHAIDVISPGELVERVAAGDL
jgi:hypothetical protein